MTDELIRRLFRDLPTARIATVGPDGAPHVTPLWFVWREDAIYISLGTGSATWANAERDPRVAVVIDRGHEWNELAGVRLEGKAEALPVEHPDLRAAMSAWHEKYRSMFTGDGFERFTVANPSLGFLRLEPATIRVWDHAARG